MSIKCLIIGISGQTGSYLVWELLKNNFEVIGTTRDKENLNLVNLNKLKLDINNIKIISLEPSDPRQVFSCLLKYKPDRIFNLSGQTSVSLSFQQPAHAIDSIANSCLNFLEAIRVIGLDTRYFNAGSSECFGDTEGKPANELTLHKPNSPYAVAKSSAIQLTRIAREAYGIHSCTGILSNHESPLRSERFVTKKIISDLKKVQKGNLECIKLGNLNVVRDWGWAYEYAKIYNKSRIFANILLYVVGPVSFLEALTCGCITISFPTRFLLEHVSDKAKKFSLLLNKSVLDFQIYIIKFLENYVPLDDFIMNLGLKFLENAKFENLALELERIADLNISNPKRANSFFIKNKKK